MQDKYVTPFTDFVFEEGRAALDMKIQRAAR